MGVISESKWKAMRGEVEGVRGRSLARAARLCIAAAAVLMLSVLPLQAQTETVLYSFAGPPADGGSPSGNLVRDDLTGNLYGTSQNGGASNAGTAFKLHPNGDGTYTESVLYSFGATSSDGRLPVAGLVMDGSGNLFGATQAGGTSTNCQFGCGTVFELVNSSGSYTYVQLYSFTGSPDGQSPGSLIIDASGNLYGTTEFGGTAKSATICKAGCGTVFELANNSGSYTYSVLFSFPISGFYGIEPTGGLVIDSSGSLYGTAPSGGHSSTCTVPLGCGVVYELVNSSGVYAPSVLYNFAGVPDGELPGSTLIADGQGNLYGTASGGASTACSSFGCGAVFKLHPNGDGSYTESVLYSFTGSPDAADPGALVMDASGNFFGIAGGGDSTACMGCGTVFELVNSSGSYTEKVLHSFTGSPDGAVPTGLVLDASDNVYGTTGSGGTSTVCSLSGCGTVFEVTSGSAGPTFAISAASGSAQATMVNTAFSAPLVAMVVNGSGTGVSDVTVTFTVVPENGAGGTFAGGVNTATTVASGLATSAVFTANGTAGPYTVTATAQNVTGTATFSLTNQAALIGTTTTINSTTSGTTSGTQSFSFPANTALVDGPQVTVKFTVAPASGTVSPTGTVVVTDGFGDTCTTTTLNSGVGTCAITITQLGAQNSPPDTTTLKATYTVSTNGFLASPPSSGFTENLVEILSPCANGGTTTSKPTPIQQQTVTTVCLGGNLNVVPTVAWETDCVPHEKCSVTVSPETPGAPEYTVTLTSIYTRPGAKASLRNAPPQRGPWLLTVLEFIALLSILVTLQLSQQKRTQLRLSCAAGLLSVLVLGGMSSCNGPSGAPAGAYTVDLTITAGQFQLVVPVTVTVPK